MPLRPPPRIGHPVDEALRKALLNGLLGYLGNARYIWNTYLSHFGCSELGELSERLEDRYGAEAADAFRTRFDQLVDALDFLGPFATASNAFSTPLSRLDRQFAVVVPWFSLLALPDEEFLMALEHVLHNSRDGEDESEYENYQEAQRFINSRFKGLGVPYWHGSVPGTYDPRDFEYGGEPGTIEFYRLTDPQLEEKVIEPALRVLSDDRFAVAAKAYKKGLTRVVAPAGRELEDAVLDFGRAVQTALFALAEAVGKTPKGGTAGALYGLLKDDPLPEASEALVLAASKIRNPVEHPRGRLIDIQHATAEAAMGAASVAITYIASFMPSPPAAGATTGFRAMMDDDIPF